MLHSQTIPIGGKISNTYSANDYQNENMFKTILHFLSHQLCVYTDWKHLEDRQALPPLRDLIARWWQTWDADPAHVL